LNLLVLIGAFRSGGDTRFALFVDGGVIWVVGVPMAALGGLVLRLPLHLVYLMLLSDEVTKLTLAMIRFRSGKWIHNLAKSVTSEGRAVAAARARSETEPLSGE
jgi:Na+-driven multidrug efflux pump